jgi:serine/threonine protein kinase
MKKHQDRKVGSGDLAAGGTSAALDSSSSPFVFFVDEPWVPKITDFGLAKRVDVGSGLTRAGLILGTLSYMAPEQARSGNEPVGRPTHVCARGAILYELPTGRPPFWAARPLDTIMHVVSEEPVPPARLTPKLPRGINVTLWIRC